MKSTIFTFLLIFVLGELYGQEKKKIDFSVYDSWKSLSNVRQSRSGNWITYEINPAIGNGYLTTQSTDNLFKRSFPRGKKAVISFNEDFIVFKINPEFDTIRNLKLEKVKKDKHPKDSLAIYFLKTDSLWTTPNIKSFKLSEEGDWMAYLSTKDLRPDCPTKKKKKKKKKSCVKSETSGKTLTLYNPLTGYNVKIHQVLDYSFNREGTYLAYSQSNKGEKDTISLTILNLKMLKEIGGFGLSCYSVLSNQQFAINNIEFDYKGNQLLFLTSNDTNERKTFSLGYWNTSLENSKIIVDSNTFDMPSGYTVSEFGMPYFSRNGSKIYIGTNKIVIQKAEDTLLDTEKAGVDVWSWNDPRIQPQQLKSLKSDKKKMYRGVYHIKENKFIQLADKDMPKIRTVNFSDEDFALGIASEPYLTERTWAFPWRSDYYYIDLKTGERTLLIKGGYGSGSLSPSGNYYVWYETPDSNWFSMDLSSKKKYNLTKSLPASFVSDNNGSPYLPFPEGSVGWTIINDVEYYMVNSEFDVWTLNLSNPVRSFCLTNEEGVNNKEKLRLRKIDRDSIYIDLSNILIHGINDSSKAESYYKLNIVGINYSLSKLIESNHRFTYFSKAKKSDKVLFRRMNFIEYPELEITDINFKNPKKITLTNPQQSKYNWGTVEFVNWVSFKGEKLKGLLYKPEDFDSTRSYPMIVYFYEKYAGNIHLHYTPRPTASIVYPTEYVSNGYIIFIPDIEYTAGHPANSAYDCIVSGTDYLTDKFNWIDTNRLGLQGQSWGGYQTAQLITMTDKYAAAMAGAPVSNMFSAYGGVRWGSGLSRMFQYERTQSRIGYTIWERPDLYIENSPLFGLPNVSTPLLIMHNDGDGAVPWYQGIELYMGMRRLEKPAWLLNYNGDAHNLMQTANRKDLSIRMRQFFDYYLLGAPMPLWMKDGVPAINKGIDYGLELENSGN